MKPSFGMKFWDFSYRFRQFCRRCNLWQNGIFWQEDILRGGDGFREKPCQIKNLRDQQLSTNFSLDDHKRNFLSPWNNNTQRWRWSKQLHIPSSVCVINHRIAVDEEDRSRFHNGHTNICLLFQCFQRNLFSRNTCTKWCHFDLECNCDCLYV